MRNEILARAEPLYAAAIARSLTRIQNEIPARDSAIQWDCVMEFMMLKRIHARREIKPSFEPLLDDIAERLASYGEMVMDGMELGYHFCYGISTV
jgi:hypothetical protein